MWFDWLDSSTGHWPEIFDGEELVMVKLRSGDVVTSVVQNFDWTHNAYVQNSDIITYWIDDNDPRIRDKSKDFDSTAIENYGIF